MRRLPPLSSLRAFEAAARHGSFKRAASELMVTATAVSHQIRTLEEHLDIRLFDRQTRRVILTEQGRALYLVLRDGFDAFAAAIERIRSERKRPVVTISATVAFSAKWLVPRVAHFQKAHPGIDLRLHASDDVVDLHSGQVDLAIRYGRGSYPDLDAHQLIADRFAPVVNPVLDVHQPADLAKVPLIHFEWRSADPDHPTWPVWFERADMRPDARSALRFTDESQAIQAAVAGQGAALLSLALVSEELDAGRLIQPFGPTLQGLVYSVVTLPSRSKEALVHAVRDWLIAEAAR